MKYIVLFTEDTTISSRLPLPAMLEAVEATRPYLDDLRRREKVVDWGFYGVGHALYVIANVKTHAELHEITELLPLRQFCAISSNPILETGEFADVFAKIKREALAQWEKIVRISNSGSGSGSGAGNTGGGRVASMY